MYLLPLIALLALYPPPFFTFAAQSAPTAQSAAPPATAFVDVTVIPMDTERRLEHQTVLVRDGRIAEIGPADKIKLAADVQRIDARGRFLLPGLADMHVHSWSEDDWPLFLANGVTTVRNMFGSSRHLMWRAEIAAGRRLGPTIYTAGPIIDGNPPVWPGSDVAETAEQAEEIVRRQKEAGYDFIKVYARLKPEVYQALLAAAKKHKLPAVGHVPEAVGLDAVLTAGQRSVEHLDSYNYAVRRADAPAPAGKRPLAERFAWDALDEEKIKAIAAATRVAGVWNCPTLIVLQKWTTVAGAKEMFARPEMKYVSPMQRTSFNPAYNYLARWSQADIDRVHAGDAARKRMVKALRDAGARLLLGTDMGNPFVVAGFSLHEELRNFVAADLTPYEALRAGTHDAAEFMGALDEWGTVAVGRRADLLLLEADPLHDMANVAQITGVMVRGRWLPRGELQAMLEELARKFAAPEPAAASQPAAAP